MKNLEEYINEEVGLEVINEEGEKIGPSYITKIVEVLDADELAEALEKGIISKEEAITSLYTLDKILRMAYAGKFPPELCLKDY